MGPGERGPTTAFSIPEIIIDIAASWIRMILALGLSILFALVIGIVAARNKRAEVIIIPLLDVFQSIPILGFFPIIIFGIYSVLPNVIGANLAVILLIFTSMSWNIAFGVYEAVKAIPQDYADLLDLSKTSAWQRVRTLYIPASLSRIAYNTQTSWAVGLFFLVSSEIIEIGTGASGTTVPVSNGIGIAIIKFASTNDYVGYAYCILALIIAVVIWRFVFLREFALWSERFKMMEEPREVHRDPVMRFYSWVNQRSISKLFLLTQGRGVSRFTSSIFRFRRGIKYALLIFFVAFFMIELGAFMSVGGLGLGGLPSFSVVLPAETYVLYSLAASFIRVWYVFAICAAIGLPLGIVISLNFKLYDSVSPILEVISSIPAPALLPAIVLIPIIGKSGEAVAAIIIMLAIIWYIIFNVMAGVRTLPADLKELPKEFHVSRWSAWRNVYIPGALTAFVTGSITAIGGAWNALIVAEYFTDQNGNVYTQVGTGVGKAITVATNQGNILVLTLAVLSMTVLIVVFNLTVWRRVYHYVTKRYAYNR
jgi:NitT/TauT family transport system permease protein